MRLGVDSEPLRGDGMPLDVHLRGEDGAPDRMQPGPPPPTEFADDDHVDEQRERGWRRLIRRPLFLAVVLIPNLFAILYFGIFASPVYTSTASIIVLNPKQNGPSLSSLLAGASGDSSEFGGYVLKNYLESWEAFQKIAVPLNVQENYRQGDLVTRYGGATSFFRDNDVTLWRYFKRNMTVKIDRKSGIVSLKVDGYSPEFAVRLARAMLADSIRHMDAMSTQQMQDFIANAVARKRGAEEALQRDLTMLARYRGQTGTYDPKELYSANLSLTNSLAMREAELRAQREALVVATPNNPLVQNLDTAIAAVKSEIAETKHALPGLSRNSARFENLLVSRESNIARLTQADRALQEAQMTAESNRYYLNVISNPSAPDTPEKPERLLWIAGVFLVSMVLWGLLR